MNGHPWLTLYWCGALAWTIGLALLSTPRGRRWLGVVVRVRVSHEGRPLSRPELLALAGLSVAVWPVAAGLLLVLVFSRIDE